jgi:hypothetical protein
LFHYKNLFYFKKHHIYTFGLLPSNLNPALVNYPFPILNFNLLVQHFFIRIIALIQKNALFYKFFLLKKYWKTIIWK